VIDRIRPQVVRSLIDEKLQMQEAAKEKIVIPDKDVTDATAAIEVQRGLAPGTIAQVIASSHVPKETFQNQLRAQLIWTKLLAKKIRPHVHVSDEEVQIAQDKLSIPVDKSELKIAVVTLQVDKPDHENEVRRVSEKLVAEVRGGANFEEVSRQFAGGASGKLETFWVLPDQLDPAIAHALLGAKAGTITDPVRSNIGYTIVKVYDTRPLAGEEHDFDVILKEILLKLKPGSDKKDADVLLQIAEEVAKHPGTCQDKTVADIKDLDAADITVDFRHTLLSELPQGLRAIAENLGKVGDISTPFASNDGIRLYMLCAKKPSSGKPVDRERVYTLLMQQKLELEAQKYMRNLRRDAFVEIRK
jgi:peptidyl-prolyl cis-trans isomerase SurA